MRITIVQSEIEEAIRNHILSQISVQEDMQINIDLRATRGAEGYQAEINIRPRTEETTPEVQPEPAPEVTSKPLKIEEAVSTAKKGRGSRTSAPKPAETADKQEPVAVEESTVNDQEQDSETAEEPAVDIKPEPEVEAPKVSSLFAPKKDVTEPEADAPATTTSIFGGLKRPVNA